MRQDDAPCPEFMRISIVPYFKDMPDPREANAQHKLIDIIVIAVCATIVGPRLCVRQPAARLSPLTARPCAGRLTMPTDAGPFIWSWLTAK